MTTATINNTNSTTASPAPAGVEYEFLVAPSIDTDSCSSSSSDSKMTGGASIIATSTSASSAYSQDEEVDNCDYEYSYSVDALEVHVSHDAEGMSHWSDPTFRLQTQSPASLPSDEGRPQTPLHTTSTTAINSSPAVVSPQPFDEANYEASYEIDDTYNEVDQDEDGDDASTLRPISPTQLQEDQDHWTPSHFPTRASQSVLGPGGMAAAGSRSVTPTPTTSRQILSWRMDPTESLSDARLEVFNRSSKVFTSYPVHRVVLAVGPRACGHFQRNSATPQQQQSSTSSSPSMVWRLPLIARACDVVPTWLDYMYDLPTFQLQTDTAGGLAYLADSLDSPPLLEQVQTFCLHDLTMETVVQYLQDAIYYDLGWLMQDIVHFISQELIHWSVHDETVRTLVADLSLSQFSHCWEQALEQCLAQDMTSTESMSDLLVEFCIAHRHELTLEHLEAWTQSMTQMSTSAAVALMELEWALSGGDTGALEASSPEAADSLQRRCLQVLSKDWEKTLEQEEQESSRALSEWVEQVWMVATHEGTSRTLFAEWLVSLLYQVHTKVLRTQRDLEASLNRESQWSHQLQRALQDARDARAETEELKQLLSSTKGELQDQLRGWMRKQSNDLVQHQAAERIWNQEREMYEQERQKWLDQQNALELELMRTKRELEALKGPKPLERTDSVQHQKAAACPKLDSASIFSYLSSPSAQRGVFDDLESLDSDDEESE